MPAKQTLEKKIGLLEAVIRKLRDASYQNHNGHWDTKGTYGANCPECIRARRLAGEADELYQRAQREESE